MKKKAEKTNVMRILDRAKVEYTSYTYSGTDAVSGADVAEALGKDPGRMFKTLVTCSPSGGYYVFMVPVCGELDLKKAARAAGQKSIAMIRQAQLEPLTGYIHGGCSPIGMKKAFETFIHESAEGCDTIIFSAGKIGCQVELTLSDLRRIIPVTAADITV